MFLLPDAASLSKPEEIFCKQLNPQQKPWEIVLFGFFIQNSDYIITQQIQKC